MHSLRNRLLKLVVVAVALLGALEMTGLIDECHDDHGPRHDETACLHICCVSMDATPTLHTMMVPDEVAGHVAHTPTPPARLLIPDIFRPPAA